jgi:hypothetical protein
MAAINTAAIPNITATVSGTTVHIVKATGDIAAADVTGSATTDGVTPSTVAAVVTDHYSAGQTVALGGVTLTATTSATPGAGEFYIGGNAAADAASLAAAINNSSLHGLGYTAAALAGNVTISLASGSIAATDITGTAATTGGGVTVTTVAGTPISSYSDGYQVTMDGVTLSATSNSTPGTNEFYIGGDAGHDAAALAAAINSSTTLAGAGYVATVSGATLLTITRTGANVGAITGSAVTGTAATIIDTPIAATVVTSYTAGQTVALGGVTLTATTAGTPGTNEFYIGGTAAADAQALAAAINANGTLTAAGYSAAASGTDVIISNTSITGLAQNVVAGDVAGTAVGTGNPITATTVAASSTLSSLQTQYNDTLAQITALAEDSGYQGKNLLSATAALRSLTVQFESSTLTVQGFDATANGLSLGLANWTAGGSASITTSITALDNASSILSQNSSSLAGNLSIITVRQDFSTNMVNTLTDGASKLTLADTNEEGANMLMLQTRQSLGTTALSLSSQAAQAVLRLFQ